MNKHKMIVIVQWLIGILFLIAGLGSFGISVSYAIAELLFGMSLLPVIWKPIKKKRPFANKWLRRAVTIGFFVLCMITAPRTDKLNEVNETKTEEDSITQDEVSTKSEADSKKAEGQDMTVHFLDVGQGLSILVQSGGENLVYDGGSRDASGFVVAYLKEQGVTTIDYLISSHYDEDHVSGLIGCLNAFSVKQVIGSDYVHDSKTYQSFMKAVQDKQLSVQHPAVGEEFEFGTGKFIILAPETIEENDSNENSVVIKLVNGENSFLFTGDAENGSEESMCQSGIDLQCDVLVLSHHGSATGTSWDFLEKTIPEYAVISCGKNNSYGHPHKDTMDKLESMEIAVYRTDMQGTLVAKSDGTALEWSQEACNDYTPGDEADNGTEPQTKNTEIEVESKAVSESNETAQPATPQLTVTPEVAQTSEPTPEATQTSEPMPEATQTPELTQEPEPTQEVQNPEQGEMVWLSETGSKYHNKPNCGRMNPDKAWQVSRSQAESMGYDACKNCYK